MSVFSERLSMLLKEHGMLNKDMADAIGVTDVTISRYLSDKRVPKSDTVLAIAKELGVTTDYLLGNDYPDDGLKEASDMWNRITETFKTQTIKGLNEYGQTLADNHSLSVNELLYMALEECVDASMYIQKIIDVLDKEKKHELLSVLGKMD